MLTNNTTSTDGNNIRSLERDSGISDHGLEDENEPYGDNDDYDYDDIDCQQFENKTGLSQDLRFLSGMPELCDVMFIVGEERQAMYGVKAILAIRSRVFFKMLYGPRGSKARLSGEGVSSAGSATVAVIGRRLLGRSSAEACEQKRNFSFLRHTNSSMRASTYSTQGPNSHNQKTVVQVEEFDPDVFKQLLEYVHTGSVVLRPRTLLGLLNAADHFALEELRRACADYSQKCINLDTVCSLLVTAERYIQYKSSKIFVQRVLDFVDKNGDDVLRLTDFVHLPRHVVELILSRDELSASEMNKFQAALRWSRHYLLYHPHDANLARTMAPFTHYVAFHSMSAQQLMLEVRPLDVVPDRILMNALAYQADPASIEVVGDRYNAVKNGASRRKSDATARAVDSEDESKFRSMTKTAQNRVDHQRSRSVDRNLSKSSNHSSNCSDSGYHDDFYSCSGADTNVARDSVLDERDRNDRRTPGYTRHRQVPAGATVVHVESPEDNESIPDSKMCDGTTIDARAKSCHDLTLLPNLTSVHYRF